MNTVRVCRMTDDRPHMRAVPRTRLFTSLPRYLKLSLLSPPESFHFRSLRCIAEACHEHANRVFCASVTGNGKRRAGRVCDGGGEANQLRQNTSGVAPMGRRDLPHGRGQFSLLHCCAFRVDLMANVQPVCMLSALTRMLSLQPLGAGPTWLHVICMSQSFSLTVPIPAIISVTARAKRKAR